MRRTLLGILVVLTATAAGCDPDSTSSDTAEPSVTAVTALAAPAGGATSAELWAGSVDRALAAASAYFTAFNSGDATAVMALLPAGATFSDAFTGEIGREAWEQRLVWNLAQGTRLSSPDCTVPGDGGSEEGTRVRCETATSNAQISAVGARPVPTLVHFTITPNGIQDVREEYGRPDFLQATVPFTEWMERKHPDHARKIGFGAWDSISEARENGELTAEYAHLWAAYLEANCIRIPDLVDPERDSYLDDC